MEQPDTTSEATHPPADQALPEITLPDLPASLQATVSRAGWKSLMPVQAKAIPYILAERDLMVQSRTGSGKTGAFILPILMRVDPGLARCQALVLVPTRELALQVSREAELLGEETGVRTVVVYGGVGYGSQIDGFRRGAHLVVGTPGRILDHLLKGSLSLDDVSVLVFDEADRMMSMGFYPDMEQIRRFLPRKRSGFMFSATYPASVRRLAGHFLRSPEFLSLSEGAVHVPQTRHAYYVAPSMDKDRVLVRVIEAENPSSAIIFCNTKAKVAYVSQVLQRFGYDADQLTSDLAQRARENVLQRLHKGNLRFLVATDVAARGIDVANLSHVFLYDFPEDQESYIHRAGRTGRAGAAGVAISLVDLMEKTELGRLAKRYSIEMEARETPTEEAIQTVVSERVVALLEATLRDRDRIRMERMRRFIPLAKSLGESDDELAIIAMLIDDYYQETLHAPPPEPPAEAGAPREESSDGGGRRRRSGRRRG